MLLPPIDHLRKLEKDLRQLQIDATSNGATSTLSKWLELIAETELMNALNLTDGTLKIKFGGDGFKMTCANGQVHFYFTIFNLGSLIHSPLFVFTLASFQGKETSDLVEKNLTLDDIDKLQSQGIDLEYKFVMFFTLLLV